MGLAMPSGWMMRQRGKCCVQKLRHSNQEAAGERATGKMTSKRHYVRKLRHSNQEVSGARKGKKRTRQRHRPRKNQKRTNKLQRLNPKLQLAQKKNRKKTNKRQRPNLNLQNKLLVQPLMRK